MPSDHLLVKNHPIPEAAKFKLVESPQAIADAKDCEEYSQSAHLKNHLPLEVLADVVYQDKVGGNQARSDYWEKNTADNAVILIEGGWSGIIAEPEFNELVYVVVMWHIKMLEPYHQGNPTHYRECCAKSTEEEASVDVAMELRHSLLGLILHRLFSFRLLAALLMVRMSIGLSLRMVDAEVNDDRQFAHWS